MAAFLQAGLYCQSPPPGEKVFVRCSPHTAGSLAQLWQVLHVAQLAWAGCPSMRVSNFKDPFLREVKAFRAPGLSDCAM